VEGRGGGKKITTLWDFSGDEQIFLVMTGIAAAVGAVGWYAPLVKARRPFAWTLGRAVLGILPIPALLLIYLVLQTLADPEQVAGHADYVTLFMIAGAAWVFWAPVALPWVGLQGPRDLLERRNVASLVVSSGTVAGVTLAYAGSNIGAGPTIWTTIVPALAATAWLFLLQGLVELLCDTADTICIDRDSATGLRTAALFAANGAILGRAAAGDWHDWRETFETFVRVGWPAIVLSLLVASLNRSLKPTPRRPVPPRVTFGLAPAVLILAVAVVWLVIQGRPERSVLHVIPSGHRPAEVAR
jgi:hypothetical protein